MGLKKEIAFLTEPETVFDLIDQALRDGVTFECVVGDGDYGDNPNFLNGLEIVTCFVNNESQEK
jgi:SRSO17 transposase